MRICVLAGNYDLILLKGTVLYHGTAETFDSKTLRGGGYDHIFWTTETATMAKTYIPVSGGSIFLFARNIAHPSTQPSVIAIQRAIGIEYDTSSFKVQNSQVVSYLIPPILKTFYEEGYLDDSKQCDYVIRKMKEVLGYEPESGDGCFASFDVKMDIDRVMKANERLKGRLLKIKLNRDFKIFDKTGSGEAEGDLMDVDYNKLNFFEKLERLGYDGVKINDFAQSHDHGNVGHTSIGFFRNSLNDLSVVEEAEAFHEDLEPYFRGEKPW